MIRSRSIIIIIFIFVIIFVAIGLNFEKDQKIKQYLYGMTKELNRDYNALYNDYLKLSKVIFDTKINSQQMINIFKDAKYASLDEQKNIREKLYKHFLQDYNTLKKYNLKQLHFHLPNNISFLRFHRPQKYGDDLTDVRSTIKYVNENKKFIHGFEEGRIYNGYRFVYPLFFEEDHIGSVEISFNTLAMTLELMKNYNVHANFLIYNKVVDQKVFNQEKSNYKPTIFKYFLIEKQMEKTIQKLYPRNLRFDFDQQTIDYIDQNSLSDRSFSIYDKKSDTIITLIKVKNPISKEVVSSFFLQSPATYINNKYTNFYTALAIILSLLSLIMFFIQKRIQSLKTIELNNEKLKSIFQEAQTGIAILDHEGKFIDMNHSLIHTLGYTNDEFLQLNLIDITSQEHKSYSKTIIKTLKRIITISKKRVNFITKENKTVPLEISISKITNEDIFILIANSLEDKLKLEELNTSLEIKIAQAVKENSKKDALLHNQSKMAALGDMLGNIAHQWRQPLSIISTLATGMKIQKEINQLKDEELLENLDVINNHTQYLSKTIDDFKSFIKGTNELTTFTVNNSIQKALNIVKLLLDKHHIKYNIYIDENISIYNHEDEFIQVLINIIQNAKDALIEHNIENKLILIMVHKDDNSVVITVQDNAGGVPEDIIDKIFEPYFTTKHKSQGTGLGLHMSYRMVNEAMNGTLEVENRTFDHENKTYKGAAFIIKLPLD